MSGWYKQLRNLSERPWYKDSCMVHLYHYLKERAYVTDGKYEGSIIRRGSCPTTRAEMMEATGLKYMKLDRTLKKLISYGEIIVKANSRFTVVTICDYDSCASSETLFRTTNETTGEISNETTNEITGETTHISTIEERYKDNLISPSSPYKNERETRDMALEIKKRYNKTFDGKLPPLIRLHEPTRRMVNACLDRFGMQSVDMVFDQVLNEPFSLGHGKTGFIANFQYIFTPTNYQQYLERAVLRQRRSQSRPVCGDAIATWNTCLTDLHKASSDAAIDQLSFVSYDDATETLLLAIPSRDVYDHIETHLTTQLATVLRRYYGNNIHVKYQLTNQQ